MSSGLWLVSHSCVTQSIPGGDLHPVEEALSDAGTRDEAIVTSLLDSRAVSSRDNKKTDVLLLGEQGA